MPYKISLDGTLVFDTLDEMLAYQAATGIGARPQPPPDQPRAWTKALVESFLGTASLAQFPRLALWALRDARDGDKLLAGLATWADAAREVLAAPNGASAMMQLLRYVALVGGDVRFEQFRASIHEQVPEAESIVMTIAEQLRAEGHNWGRTDTLIELLTLKFGEPAQEHRARVVASTEAQLQRWLARVLTASSVEAVFADD